jgi:hypothetical protein
MLGPVSNNAQGTKPRAAAGLMGIEALRWASVRVRKSPPQLAISSGALN